MVGFNVDKNLFIRLTVKTRQNLHFFKHNFSLEMISISILNFVRVNFLFLYCFRSQNNSQFLYFKARHSGK